MNETTTERRIFAHDSDCPAASTDPATRLLTMAARGMCNCWHEQLTGDLELYGLAIVRRRVDGEIERMDPRRTVLQQTPPEVVRVPDEVGALRKTLELGEATRALERSGCQDPAAWDFVKAIEPLIKGVGSPLRMEAIIAVAGEPDSSGNVFTLAALEALAAEHEDLRLEGTELHAVVVAEEFMQKVTSESQLLWWVLADGAGMTIAEVRALPEGVRSKLTAAIFKLGKYSEGPKVTPAPDEVSALRKTLEQREEEMDEVIRLLPRGAGSGRLVAQVELALKLARAAPRAIEAKIADDLTWGAPMHWEDDDTNRWRLELAEVNEVVWRFKLSEENYPLTATGSSEFGLMAEGHVKWDGCSDVTIGESCMWHGCDGQTFQVLARALEIAYWACARQLGDKWDLEPPPPDCPRCSECTGQAHHWLEPESFIAVSDIPVPPELDVDDMVTLRRCKHCPAVRKG